MKKHIQETKIFSQYEIPLVDVRGVYDENHALVENFKRIVDLQGKTIAVNKKDYQLVQHRDVYGKILENKDVEIINATVYRDGRTMVIEVQPKQNYEIELVPQSLSGERDVLTPIVRIFNSYDLTRALTVQSFGMRLICLNGAVAPGGVDRVRKPHIFMNADIGKINGQVAHAFKTWELSGKTLSKAYTKIVDIEDTLKLLKYLPDKYKKTVIQNLRRNDTLYNLWNELTSLITHEIQPRVATDTLVNYQGMVNKIFKVLAEDEVTENTPLPESQSQETQTQEENEDEDEEELGE